MWLNEQRIEVLLTAYCALVQAESEDMSRNIKWGIKRGDNDPDKLVEDLAINSPYFSLLLIYIVNELSFFPMVQSYIA